MKFESGRPHFLIMITEPHVPDQILRIPMKCFSKYRHKLPRIVKIKVPNGEVWEVEFNKTDGHFWLQGGWNSFRDHYSIDYPYCLNFMYDGRRDFELFIHDGTACEIDYPLLIDQEVSESDADDNNTVEYLGEVLANDKGGGSSSSSSSSSSSLTQKMDSAGASSSGSSFVVKMEPAYVSSLGHQLPIPTEFCKRHFNEVHSIVNLHVADGRTWKVDCHQSRALRQPHYWFRSGWKTFAADNKLEAGDVCSFEIIENAPESSFLVAICRAGQEGSS